MMDFYNLPELHSAFTRKCLDKFKFLIDCFDYEITSVEVSAYAAEVTYKNQTTAVKVSYEHRENSIFVYLIRLINGDVPAYLDAPSRWFYLDNVVQLKSSSTVLFGRRPRHWLQPEDLDQLLTTYADALRKYAIDVLRGDFSVFGELKKQFERPAQVRALGEVALIMDREELVAQQQRLPAQITEYHDTYFFELRDQLQRPDLFDEAVPNFLKGYKRVVSIGCGDGLVIAHFPMELEITVSKTEGRDIVLRLPSLPDAQEDHYNFVQFPGSSVEEIATLLSGGENIGLEIPSERAFWGVRGFKAPQQKIDTTTGELVWEAPWTRLAAADLYHLRYWENTERARMEVEEDIDPYVRNLSEVTKATSLPTQVDPTALPEIGQILAVQDEPQVGFGRDLDLRSVRDRGNEDLRVPVTQYAL